MNLTANFSLNELTLSQEASRRGIINIPSEEVVARLRVLAQNVLQPVRDHFGPVVVSSGYRSPQLNRAIGGSKTSEHCFGYAADFISPGVDNKVLATWIRSNLPFTQLILEFYSSINTGWVHCSYNVDNLKKQVLTASRTSKGVVYTPGIL